MATINGITDAYTGDGDDLRRSWGVPNILVTVMTGYYRGWSSVYVRHSYSPLADDASALAVEGLPTAPDADWAPDWPGIAAAVAELRARYGHLPVQVNEWRDRQAVA